MAILTQLAFASLACFLLLVSETNKKVIFSYGPIFYIRSLPRSWVLNAATQTQEIINKINVEYNNHTPKCTHIQNHLHPPSFDDMFIMLILCFFKSKSYSKAHSSCPYIFTNTISMIYYANVTRSF